MLLLLGEISRMRMRTGREQQAEVIVEVGDVGGARLLSGYRH